MEYVEFTGPKRDGLRAGEPAPEESIDIRAACVTDRRADGGLAPCGSKIRVAVSGDWSRLVRYRYYKEGHPRRSARPLSSN